MKQHQAWVLVAALAAGCVTPRAERASKALAAAAEHKAQHRLDEAAEEYRDALDADPTNLVALRGLVETHHRLGRLAELERRFEAQLAKAPGDAYAHEGLGLVFYALGSDKGARARAELTKAAELAPKVADFHYRLGVLLVESDEYPAAREALAKAIALDGKRARYRLPYALALARTGDRAAAVKQLDEVLRLGPSREEVVLAEKTAAQLIDPFRGFPDAAREQYGLALGWLNGDAPAQARQVLDSLLEKFPDLAIVHATAGLCALRMDDAGRAISEFRRASELAPELAEPRLFLGDIYSGRGRHDMAGEHYEAALARNPFLADAHRRLAEVHLRDGEKDRAAARFGTYLLLRPDDFEANVARATVLTELGRAEAGDAWDDFVERFPRRPEALVGHGKYWFARALGAKERDERAEAGRKAQKSLEVAIEADPENATATALLAQVRRL